MTHRHGVRLLLLRHGVAEDAGPATGHLDAPRSLTARGRERMARQAQGMVTIGLVADVVLTSPLTRCRQTADIVAEALGAEVHEDLRLEPGADLDAVADVLLEYPDAEHVLVCGHQPDLSRIVSALTGGGLVEFGRGSLAVLDLVAPRPRGGHLRALYPPPALRSIAGDGG